MSKICDSCKNIMYYDPTLDVEVCSHCGKTERDFVSRYAVENMLLKLWHEDADEDYKFETLHDYIVELPSASPSELSDFVQQHDRINVNLQITKIHKHVSNFEFEEEYIVQSMKDVDNSAPVGVTRQMLEG